MAVVSKILRQVLQDISVGEPCMFRRHPRAEMEPLSIPSGFPFLQSVLPLRLIWTVKQLNDQDFACESN